MRLYSEALKSSQRMDEFLADVYLGIGELAVDSQKYYLRPSYGMLGSKALCIGETDSWFSSILASSSSPTRARYKSESR